MSRQPAERWSNRRRRRQKAAQTAKRHPMFAGAYAQLAHRRGAHIATVAIARRLLARSFHILTQLESAPEKATTGRARVFARACNTAADLTEQPGPDSPSCGPLSRGPEWVHASHLRTAVRAFSSATRPTLQPHHPATQGSGPGLILPRLLTGPDPMGARTALTNPAGRSAHTF
jgi:hypothetical protein